MKKWILRILAGLMALVILGFGFMVYQIRSIRIEKDDSNLEFATSKDGTRIAYQRVGKGPVVILVGGALSERSGSTLLARELSEKFTAVNYDRRGRGKSTDTQPFSPVREIEDIDALISVVGAPAHFFGVSSGAVLALEAAKQLGGRVGKLYMYEPPFVVDGSRAPVPGDLVTRIQTAVAAGNREEGVKLFFSEAIGIPGFFVSMMKLLMPTWPEMLALAQTLPYDFAVLEGTQMGKALPPGRWTSVQTPTRVVVGENSEEFFRTGARALLEQLPHGELAALSGQDHSAAVTAPKELAKSMADFFGK